jgi:hypothetical protein
MVGRGEIYRSAFEPFAVRHPFCPQCDPPLKNIDAVRIAPGREMLDGNNGNREIRAALSVLSTGGAWRSDPAVLTL